MTQTLWFKSEIFIQSDDVFGLALAAGGGEHAVNWIAGGEGAGVGGGEGVDCAGYVVPWDTGGGAVGFGPGEFVVGDG